MATQIAIPNAILLFTVIFLPGSRAFGSEPMAEFQAIAGPKLPITGLQRSATGLQRSAEKSDVPLYIITDSFNKAKDAATAKDAAFINKHKAMSAHTAMFAASVTASRVRNLTALIFAVLTCSTIGYMMGNTTGSQGMRLPPSWSS